MENNSEYLDVSGRLLSSSEWAFFADRYKIDNPSIFNSDGSYTSDGLFSTRIWPKTDSCPCGQTHGQDSRGLICPRCNARVASVADNDTKLGVIHLESPVPGIYYDYIKLLCRFPDFLGSREKIFDSYRQAKDPQIAKIMANTIGEQAFRSYLYGTRVLVFTDDRHYDDEGNITIVDVQAKEVSITEAEVLSKEKDTYVLSCGELLKYVLSKLDPQECIQRLENCLKFYEENSHVENINEYLKNLISKDSLSNEEKTLYTDLLVFSLDESRKLLSMLEDFVNLRDSYGNSLKLSDLMTSNVFVSPPSTRPISSLSSSSSIGDRNQMYVELLLANEKIKTLESSNAPLQSIILAKNNLQKQYQKLQEDMVTKMTAKEGLFNDILEKKYADGTCYLHASLGLGYKADEVGLSRAAALVTLEPYVIKRLKELDTELSTDEARALVRKHDEKALKALEDIASDHVVLISRSPEFYEHAFVLNKVVLIDDVPGQENTNIRVNPMQCAAMNLDFDGDQIRVQGIWDEETEQKAIDYMHTYPNLFASTTGKLLVSPKQDAALGIYYATRDPHDFTYGYGVRVSKIEEYENINRVWTQRVYDSFDSFEDLEIKDRDGNDLAMTERGIFIEKGSTIIVSDKNNSHTFKAAADDCLLLYQDGKYSLVGCTLKSMNVPKSCTLLCKAGDILDNNNKAQIARYDKFETFRSLDQIKTLLSKGQLLYNQKIVFNLDEQNIETTVGRVLFNDLVGNLDKAENFENRTFSAKELERFLMALSWKIDRQDFVNIVSSLWNFGFESAKNSGISTKMTDFIFEQKEPETKKAEITKDNSDIKALDKLLESISGPEHPEDLSKQFFYENADERIADQKPLFIDEIKKDPESNLAIIMESGARGSWVDASQVTLGVGSVLQKSGLVYNQMIDNNYLDGLKAEDLVPAAVQAQTKGDKSSGGGVARIGYLSDYLKNALSDITIEADDCKTENYLTVDVDDSVLFRYLAKDVKDDKGNVLYKKDSAVTLPVLEDLKKNNINEIQVRSPITCDCKTGLCKKCYGLSAKTHEEVESNLGVGYIAGCNFNEEATQNLLNVNKGKTIVSALEMISELFKSDNSESGFINSPEDYKDKLLYYIDRAKKVYAFTGLDIASRNIEIMARAMHSHVDIVKKGNAKNLEVGKTYDIRDVLYEYARLSENNNENSFPVCKVNTQSMRDISYDKVMKNPSQKDTINVYRALVDSENSNFKDILAAMSLSSKKRIQIKR